MEPLSQESEDESLYSSEEEEDYFSSEDDLSDNMADVHTNLLKQQKKYEGKVTFFLEGEEKGPAVKPKTRPAGSSSSLTSGSARARASSASLHKSSTSLQKSTTSLQKSTASLQRQKAVGSSTSRSPGTTSTTGQRQQLSAASKRDVTGTRPKRNGGPTTKGPPSTYKQQPPGATKTAGTKEVGAKQRTTAGTKPPVTREGSGPKTQSTKPRSASNQRQTLQGKNGSGKSTVSVYRQQQPPSQRQDGKKDASSANSNQLAKQRSSSEEVKSNLKQTPKLTTQTSAVKEGETKSDAVKKNGNRIPAPLGDLSPMSSSESEQKKSESSDNDSPVKLYQPKPTLKEIAEAKTPTLITGKDGSNSSTERRSTEEGDSLNSHQTFNFGKTPETIMAVYEEREKDFMKQFAFSLEPEIKVCASIDEGVCSPDVILPSIDDAKNESESVQSDIRKTETKFKPILKATKSSTIGINHVENLLNLMENLSQLKAENSSLKRKCNYLEDVRSLLNLQNQMMSASRVKPMNKTESFISKAQSKVKHYLASPAHPQYNRGHSDSGSAFTPDLLETPKTSKHVKGSLQRSSSVGSIEDLNIISTIAAQQMRSLSTEKPDASTLTKGGATSRKKAHKKKFQWTKMKKVFSKPESPGKSEGGAISAEEIIRVNKQKSFKPSLASSKSVDHGDLMCGSISDDNYAVNTNNNSHLSVEPPGSVPPSPNSIQSEPGTAFPVTTLLETASSQAGFEHEYKEISPLQNYVDIGGTQSVRTTVRTISQSGSCYSNQAYEDRLSLSDNEADKARYFSIGGPLIRRKSSPTLSLQGSAELSSLGLNAPVEMRRSSSFKTTRPRRSHMDDRSITSTAYITENLLSPEDARRAQLQLRSRGEGDMQNKAKAAWFKVKDMIHTRKDSIKKTRRRSGSGGEDIEISPEGSSWEDRGQFPGEESYYDDMMMLTNNEQDPHISRDTAVPVFAAVPVASVTRSHTVKPVTSSPKPIRKRAASVKSPSEVTHESPISAGKRDSVTVMTGAGSPVDIAALMGGINEDFHKKMAEWEDKKKGISGTGDFEKGVNFSEDFIRRMEQWERMKGLEGNAPPKPTKPTKPKEVKKTKSPPPVAASTELPNLAGGETVEHLSETFSKTVQEWERIKEKRAKEPESSSGTKSRSSRRTERSKSRDRDKHPREKSRQRYEREIQKREQKLEKERQKLDRMKQKLDQPSEWSHSEGPDILSKFQDWELLKSFNSALSMGELHHSRSRSEKRQREPAAPLPSRERVMSDSLLDQITTQDMETRAVSMDPECGLENGIESPPTQPSTPLVDDSTSIDLGLTMETIAMLEGANEKLSIALSEREDEIASMHSESREMTQTFKKMMEQHNTDIDQYKKELWASSKIGHYSIESHNLTNSLKQLKQKLNELQEYGEKVMVEKLQSNANELSEKEKLSMREQELLEQIASIQSQLDSKVYVRGTEVFDTLYRHIHNVHKQVHNLQCGVLERDHMISSLQRHVMIQEVYNNLLNTEIQRREAAVNFLKQQRKAGILRRWNTFHGQDITIRQDGTIELKKSGTDGTCHIVPPSVKKLKQEAGALIQDRSEALALHFDWLESMKEQIQEVQESQTADVDIQVSADINESDTQTLLSLLNPQVPLGRLQWDGSHIDVCDQAVQKTITTADAAVFIEDLDVYENKQKSKRKLGRGKVDKTIPQKGTVFKRMEMFDPHLKEKTPHEGLSKTLSSKSTESMEEEQCKNKTVIGRKVLDYELCEYTTFKDDDNKEKELSPTLRQRLVFDSEPVEPVSVLYRESGNYRQTIGSASSYSTITSESPKLQRFSVTSSDIEVSFTLTLPDQDDDENAKDLKSEKDFTKRSSYSEDDLLLVEANYCDAEPTEIVFKPVGSSNSESDVRQKIPAEVPVSASCDDILESRPPLSPIIRSKYARKQKAELKQQIEGRISNINTPKRSLRLEKHHSSEDNGKTRGRTASESSMLHSKYGSDDIEETTAAKFSVNMERYLIKPRTLDAIPLQEKTVRSFEAQPFSRDCLFRKSPSPAMRKPAVSAIRTLKTAEELLNETLQMRGRSLSVPRDGFGGGTFHAKSGGTSGIASRDSIPHSVPSASPEVSRKAQTELLKAVTKRLSLPSGQLSPDLAGLGQGEGQTDNANASRRKALLLEPVVVDKNRQLRPHSVISYISEGSESQTSESIWQKLVKSSSLHRGTPATGSTSPKSRSHSGRPFKLFTRKFHHGASNKRGTISKLCMQTVTLDTSGESETSSIQFLPDDGLDIEGPITAEASGHVTSSPTSGKKQKRKPFLDAKWLSRSKRFFKGSNFNRDSKSESGSFSEADDSSQTNSLCDGTHNTRGNNPQQQQHGNQPQSGEYNLLQQQQPEGPNTGAPAVDTSSFYSNYSDNSLDDLDSEGVYGYSGNRDSCNLSSESDLGAVGDNRHRSHSEGNVHRIPIIQIHNEL